MQSQADFFGRRTLLVVDPELDLAALTYPEVGATSAEALPSGYRHVREQATVGSGADCFLRTTQQLFSWRLHVKAGLDVSPQDNVRPGMHVELRLRLGLLRLTAPCLVVYSVRSSREAAFAYGTLPGHPECGEQRFGVVWRDDDAVMLSVAAFSRPALWWSRAGGPVTHRVQDMQTRRYLSALS